MPAVGAEGNSKEITLPLGSLMKPACTPIPAKTWMFMVEESSFRDSRPQIARLCKSDVARRDLIRGRKRARKEGRKHYDLR